MTSLPRERFYWAEIDPGPIAPRRVTSRRLGYLFEPVLPVPLESVHAVYARSSRGAYVACAMDREALKALRTTESLAVTPSSTPEFIGGTVGPDRLNLLTGEFEAAAIRRARTRWTLRIAAIMALAATLLTIGLQRRIDHAAATRRAVTAAITDAIERAVPASASSSQLPELVLVSELRRLEQTRAAPSWSDEDVALPLAAILSAWPREAEARTQSIIATPAGLTVNATVADHDRAQILATALTPTSAALESWRSAQPQVRSERGGMRVTIRLSKEAER